MLGAFSSFTNAVVETYPIKRLLIKYCDRLHDAETVPSISNEHVILSGTLLMILSLIVAVLSRLMATITTTIKRQKVNHSNVVYPIPHVTSWIPYIGSAIDMGSKRTIQFIRKHAERLNSPLFTATILGNKTLFLADARLLNQMLRHHTDVIDRNLQHEMLFFTAYGLPREEVDEMISPAKHMIALKQHKQFIQGRDAVQSMINDVKPSILRLIKDQYDPTCTERVGDWCARELFDVVDEVFYPPVATTTTSPLIAGKEYLALMRDFARGLPMATTNLPNFFLPSYRNAVEKICAAMMTREFHDNCSDFVKARYTEHGFRSDFVNARVCLVYLFASTSNSSPAIFWLLYHVLKNPEALRALQKEIDEMVDSLPHNDPSYLTMEHIDEMAVFASCWQETTRVNFSGTSAWRIKNDFLFSPKLKDQEPKAFLVPKGTIMMPTPVMQHMDPEIFEDPEEFHYDRFLAKHGKAPEFFSRNGTRLVSPVMSFGYGNHRCPGEKFAQYAACIVAVGLFTSFEVRLTKDEQSKQTPDADLRVQGIGLNLPDRKVFIELRPRRRN